MYRSFVLAVFCLYSVHASDEFSHFKTLLKAKHAARIRPKIDHIGRQADPCRIAALTGLGRAGQSSSIPTSAEKVLMQMKNTADSVTIGMLAPEKKADACEEALSHSKDRNLNSDICAEALAHYMKRKESTQGPVGRSGGDSATAWDELYGDLSESLTTDQIMEQLDLWNPASLGLLIDNTGSMADDIDQVSRITENFLKTELYFEDIIYNFVIMSFGDPDYQEPTAYWEPTQAVNHVNSKIVASMGGDCPEMTCQAIEQILSYSDMFSDSPIFVFTDASSKDCDEDLVTNVEEWALDFSHSLNFVLTGTCGDEVDGNFTRLAASTGGSIFRLEDDELFKLTDIVAEATEDGDYIAYDDWEDDWADQWDRKKRDTESELSEHLLMRRRRQAGFTTLSFYVDETVGRLAMQVTFEKHADRRLLEGITMSPQDNCDTHNQEIGSRFGNIVHYAVHCPCVGEWQIKVPYSIDNSWTFSAKTFGDFSIGFDVNFEQAAANGNIEWTKQPCAGDTAKLVITLTQRDSIDDDSRIDVILNGRSFDDIFRLRTRNNDKWYVDIRIPKVPFKVAVRGTTVAGNTFLRIHNTEIKPTTTCLKTENIRPSSLTIKAGRETTIIMSLENKFQTGDYKLFCFNDRQRDGFETKIERPRNRMHRVIDPDRLYYIFIKVTAPQVIDVGEVVNVWCVVRSSTDRAIKSYKLMVASWI